MTIRYLPQFVAILPSAVALALHFLLNFKSNIGTTLVTLILLLPRFFFSYFIVINIECDVNLLIMALFIVRGHATPSEGISNVQMNQKLWFFSLISLYIKRVFYRLRTVTDCYNMYSGPDNPMMLPLRYLHFTAYKLALSFFDSLSQTFRQFIFYTHPSKVNMCTGIGYWLLDATSLFCRRTNYFISIYLWMRKKEKYCMKRATNKMNIYNISDEKWNSLDSKVKKIRDRGPICRELETIKTESKF